MKQTWIAVIAVIVIIVAIVIIVKTVHKPKPTGEGEEIIGAPPAEYEQMMQGQPQPPEGQQGPMSQ